MTEQTPLERLDEAINEIRECFARPLAEQLLDSSIKYMRHAEARIKELENALHEVKEREVREIERTIVAEAKLKAWEDAPTVSVYVEQDKNDIPRLYIEDCSDSADYGTYHLKPAEADDAQGN